jgi:hypothetical protein
MQKLLALVFGISLVAFVGVAAAKDKAAKHNHHHVKSMLGDKLKKDGTHQIHKKGEYTSHVDVKGGKIAGFHVKHPKKGDVEVKKYKSSKKYASLDGSPSEQIPAQDVVGTQWIGYSYVDDLGETEIFWVEYDLVLDPSGAIDYVPITPTP